MDATWIVTANAGRARFFSQSRPSDRLEEVNDMINDIVRQRTSDIDTDRMGPTSAGQSIHNTGGATPNKTYEPAQTPIEHETELFARSVAGYLLHAHQEGRYKGIVLAASPQFLGVLRKMLDPQLKPLVNLEINKDYTQASPTQLVEQIQAHKTQH